MSDFKPPDAKTFAIWDYVVFAALFLVSAGIGVFFAVKERKKKTSSDFLVGGKQLTFGPVALSLTASFMSAVTVLGTPSEVYRFGASFIVFFLAYSFVVIFTAELFVPVFYRSGITSTYEYLELRFNKFVRYAATAIYIVQTILYTGVVVYAPALALNQEQALTSSGITLRRRVNQRCLPPTAPVPATTATETQPAATTGTSITPSMANTVFIIIAATCTVPTDSPAASGTTETSTHLAHGRLASLQDKDSVEALQLPMSPLSHL